MATRFMARDKAVAEIDLWLQSPPGRYVLEWQQQQLDRCVSNLFGFHALQLGWPALQGLRTNRMPHRWLLTQPGFMPGETGLSAAEAPARTDGPDGGPIRPSVLADFEALPFPSQTLDLAVLPHTLEVADDPHQTLREVERVLVPEGRVVILGFNPSSWLGAWCTAGMASSRLGGPAPSVPVDAELIGWLRLRDWLRLLSFEIETVEFGCYRPPLRSQPWLDRLDWMERAGSRWWPVFGCVYFVVAVKRVRGMTLTGKAWKRRRLPAGKAALVTRRSGR